MQPRFLASEPATELRRRCANDASGKGRREFDESQCHENAVCQRALRFATPIHDLDLVPLRRVDQAVCAKFGNPLRAVLRIPAT